MRRRAEVAAALSATLVAACGAPFPGERISSVRGAMRAANELGADERPPLATLHMLYAGEQVTWAKALVADGDYARAERMLRRAEADAELAAQLAREEHAREAAEKADDELAAARAARAARTAAPRR